MDLGTLEQFEGRISSGGAEQHSPERQDSDVSLTSLEDFMAQASARLVELNKVKDGETFKAHTPAEPGASAAARIGGAGAASPLLEDEGEGATSSSAGNGNYLPISKRSIDGSAAEGNGSNGGGGGIVPLMTATEDTHGMLEEANPFAVPATQGEDDSPGSKAAAAAYILVRQRQAQHAKQRVDPIQRKARQAHASHDWDLNSWILPLDSTTVQIWCTPFAPLAETLMLPPWHAAPLTMQDSKQRLEAFRKMLGKASSQHAKQGPSLLIHDTLGGAEGGDDASICAVWVEAEAVGSCALPAERAATPQSAAVSIAAAGEPARSGEAPALACAATEWGGGAARQPDRTPPTAEGLGPLLPGVAAQFWRSKKNRSPLPLSRVNLQLPYWYQW